MTDRLIALLEFAAWLHASLTLGRIAWGWLLADYPDRPAN